MPLKGAKKEAANNKKYYTDNKERISEIKKEETSGAIAIRILFTYTAVPYA